MNKQLKQKLFALLAGIILMLVGILLFFMDTSLEWNYLKILSCIIATIWLFFIPPTIMYYDYKSKNSSMQYNIRLGVLIGSGCFLGILIAPIIGTKTYFSNLDNISE